MTRIDDVQVDEAPGPPVWEERTEIVERKGIGHPDTICDSIAEAASRGLCEAYLEVADRVMHHNVDKALLVPGSSSPAFGGGLVHAPMRLILSGQATDRVDGRQVPVGEIASACAIEWVGRHLRFVDPEQHLALEDAIRPGSAQLTGIFAEERPGANDTSVGVGYAPLSETERLVIEAERHLVSAGFQQRFPESGEDVKVMAVRRDRRLELTVAVAVVDRFVPSEAVYFERKAEMRDDLAAHLKGRLEGLDELEVALNVLDGRGRGVDGVYLTVLGTSAEGADGGQVGRGNRANGVISFGRPMSLEAVAGKNPVSHVGKIYNLLSSEIAARVLRNVEGIRAAEVLLCSRIGSPLSEPALASTRLTLAAGVHLADVEAAVRDIVRENLRTVGAFVTELTRSRRPVC